MIDIQEDAVSPNSVYVVGSANIDLRLGMKTLPEPGQTVLASTSARYIGGKGANQAVASAQSGVPTTFIGCVGDDEDGKSVLRALRESGISTGEVELMGGISTGLATVMVSDDGNNSIVVVPGANSRLSPLRARTVLNRSCDERSVVVLQAEIPYETVQAVISAGRERDSTVVFNIAPYAGFPIEIIRQVDFLILNEVEASQLLKDLGIERTSPKETASEVAKHARKGAVVTFGSQGAYWATKTESGHVPAEKVRVVDTTGAGDSFVGAFSAAIAEGKGVEESVRIGTRLAGRTVQYEGAQKVL